MLVAPPLEVLLATSAIESGLALRILDEIRAEMKERHAILKTILPQASVKSGALHAWLSLPKNWPRAEFVAQLATRFIRIAPSDAFAVPPGIAPNNVRLSIGAVATQQELTTALGAVADLIEAPPNFAGDVA
jgi:DNA-binding transcriptional MocR family regulator